MIDLEINWFYRLVKVMYVLFLAVGLIGVLCAGWDLKPYQYINNEKSYLTCPDGTRYSFKILALSFYTRSSFDDYEKESVIKTCNKHLSKSTDPNEFNFENLIPVDGDPYPTHWVYETRGSWIEAIELWLLGSLIAFLIFNGIKQSLLYIVYGKKFTLGCRK
jgi:hypothetical protein